MNEALFAGNDQKLPEKGIYLKMNPVHSVSDILEHALIRHKKVAIFEASLTTTETVHIMFTLELGLHGTLLLSDNDQEESVSPRDR